MTDKNVTNSVAESPEERLEAYGRRISANIPPITENSVEVLPVDSGLFGDTVNAVDEEGNVIPVTVDTALDDATEDQEARAERLEKFCRVLGILASPDIGLMTIDSQVNALKRPEFYKVDPNASEEEIKTAALEVIAAWKEEDDAGRDARSGS